MINGSAFERLVRDKLKNPLSNLEQNSALGNNYGGSTTKRVQYIERDLKETAISSCITQVNG